MRVCVCVCVYAKFREIPIEFRSLHNISSRVVVVVVVAVAVVVAVVVLWGRRM